MWKILSLFICHICTYTICIWIYILASIYTYIHDFICTHTYNDMYILIIYIYINNNIYRYVHILYIKERNTSKIDIDRAGARWSHRLSPSFGGCLGGWTSSLALPTSVAPAQWNGEPREPCVAVPRFVVLILNPDGFLWFPYTNHHKSMISCLLFSSCNTLVPRHMLTALSLAPLRWAHLNSLAEQQMYARHRGGFLKCGIPKSPWASISSNHLKWSNDLDDLGFPKL